MSTIRTNMELIMQNINVEKLTRELMTSGIKISGCNSDGIVWAEDGITEIQDRKNVKAIIKIHDPTPDPVETLEKKIERIVKNQIDDRVIIKR